MGDVVGVAVVGALVVGAAVEGAVAGAQPDEGQILPVPEQPPVHVYAYINGQFMLPDMGHTPELQVPRPLQAEAHVM